VTPIPKAARDASGLERRWVPFPDGRSALRALFERAAARSDGSILLPAYVGWSPREGSGVFDPVDELGLPHAFYRVDRALRIDLDSLARELERRPAALVLIHYFGTVDPAAAEAARRAHAAGIPVIEDEAHALLTDLVSGICGRLGDACIASLKKLLPVDGGGGMLVNASDSAFCEALDDLDDAASGASPFGFDLATMARARQRNAARLSGLLAPLSGRIDVLRAPAAGEIPQTLPVIVRDADRDELYERMNAAGFGVVSLYHTMVEAIPRDEFPDSYELARTIMNLPVHQEADEESLAALVTELDRLTAEPAQRQAPSAPRRRPASRGAS
jgi:dTDP-4-amino-4,6-dideoxygalactose transaminase